MSWPQVLGTFLTGTARGSATETDALNDAAMATAMRRAGFVAPRPEGALPEAAPSDAKAALEASEPLLRRCLDEHSDLVIEWCGLAARAGVRAPDAVLPDLLDFVARQPKYVPNVQPVLGERGRWLAAQNPAWAALFSVEPEIGAEEARRQWEEGTQAERRRILRVLTQRDPGLRRELIASTWKTEPAKVRTEFVEAFLERVYPEDEAFLTQCLTDRSMDVRYTATQALGLLPGNAVGDEVFALVQEFVRFDARNLPIIGRPMTIEAPQMDDTRLDRFGIASAKGAATIEQRRGRLTRLIGLVPPYRWEADGSRPEALVRQLPNGPPGQAVRDGLTVATRLTKDAGWAEALLADRKQNNYSQSDLIAYLPRESQERMARAILKSGTGSVAWEYAQAAITDLPWTPAFTREFLDLMQREVTSKGVGFYPESVRGAILSLDPTVARLPEGETRADWSTTLEFWRRVLDLRRAMHTLFERSPRP
ncbi:MAG: DUF5691 domain-containing protein [Fimbriimonas sp.]